MFVNTGVADMHLIKAVDNLRVVYNHSLFYFQRMLLKFEPSTKDLISSVIDFF